MLTLLLVWTVALGSLSIFLAGMIFPELSRKNDLIWVGVGLFYALILYANKSTMGGGLLLGQTAGISLTVWLGWQAMTQRRELTAEDKKTPVPDWLQKIIDIATPLWEKAYGAIAGQLGLEDGASEASESGDALSGLKSQVMGFLDKLNNPPENNGTATDSTPTADTDDIADDWDEEDEAASEESDETVAESEESSEAEEEATPEPEPVAETEVVAESTPEPVAEPEVVVEEEPEPIAETEPEAEAAPEPVEETEAVAEAAPEPVAETEGVSEPEVTPEAPEAEAPVQEDISSPTEATAEAAAPEPVVTDATPTPAEQPQPEAEESNWPDAEPMNSGDPQEESNWPPNEPVD